MAEMIRLDLGNINPIYERELNKPDVHQRRGRWNVSNFWEGGRGCLHKEEEGGESTVGDKGCVQVEWGVRPRRAITFLRFHALKIG